jgi:HSP90 family molecular chaperone
MIRIFAHFHICVSKLEPADDLIWIYGYMHISETLIFISFDLYFFFRFHSTNDTEELTSLDEYISRMKPEQDTILYLPGDTKEAILKSPILKKYVKQGYEVLLLHDPIDEFCTQHLSEYEKRKVKSIAKDDVSLIDNNDELAKKKL